MSQPKRRTRSGNNNRKPTAAASPRDFWSNPNAEARLAELAGPVIGAGHSGPVEPTALARSLGEPPLDEHSYKATHYFAAVYTKAAQLAVAATAASKLERDTP